VSSWAPRVQRAPGRAGRAPLPSLPCATPTAPVSPSAQSSLRLATPFSALQPQATLAAANVAGVLQGYGAWPKPNDVTPFLEAPIASLPRAAPSIVNAKEIGLATAAA
jgi:hypothetical protein